MIWPAALFMILSAMGNEIVFQCGFDSDKDFSRWKKIPGWNRSPNGGRNGTGAAVLSRKTFAGPLTSVTLDSLKPGVLYRLSVWVKPENLESDGKMRNYGAFCIEFVKDGKWMSGYYPLTADRTDKWQRCSLDFMLKPMAEKTSIVLYMRKGFRGTLYFDDVTLEEAGDHRAALLVTSPSQLTFFGTSGELKVSGCASGNEKKSLFIHIAGDGMDLRKVLPESAPGEFRLPLDNLKPGELKVQMVLRGNEKNNIIAKSGVRLFVREKSRQKSRFDAAGNLLLDGNKFLPIGIFGGFPETEDLKKVSDAGFNTIVDYSSFSMNFGGSAKSHAERLIRSLDVIQRNGLKLIFSLKDQYPGMQYAVSRMDGAQNIDSVVKYTVNRLKDHPAILGWYISDELSRSELPMMVALRELIARNDPHHPAVTLTFRENDFPVYGQGGDVVAVDCYPIVRGKEKDLLPLEKVIKAAKLGRQPVWMVPQVFNMGVYKAKTAEDFSEFVYPSEKEIKAMNALAVIYGCKGFIFYSYTDVCGRRGKSFFPENEAEQWKNICSAVAMLKKIEPFILSDHAAETVVDNDLEVIAKLRRGNGGKLVVAVRKNLGASKLPLPCGRNYTLIDGKAEFFRDQWYFTGEDVDFCILQEKSRNHKKMN